MCVPRPATLPHVLVGIAQVLCTKWHKHRLGESTYDTHPLQPLVLPILKGRARQK